MSWQAIPESELWDLLSSAEERMGEPQRRLWDAIRIQPQKWLQHPYGDKGNGFWVVGIVGTRVVWYNDVEEGFNVSRYSTFGVIDEYWCNQDNLDTTMQWLVESMQSGK